jgi:pSer/pThr/pTyr-binding forkhead associated (FHA) protein
MQVVLVSFRGEGERRSFSVVKESTVIGRREDCDLRIPVSEVSRKHCRIVKDGDQLRVEDLGSSNGTYHNGQRVQGGTVLNPGDSVQVGPVVFVVQIDGNPPDDDLMPFKERAAHELDDSVAESSTAAALHPVEPNAAEVEEHLEELEAMPVAEEEDIESLEAAAGSHAPIPLDLHDSTGDEAAHPMEMEIGEAPAGGEAGQGTEHGSAPIPLDDEHAGEHEHAAAHDGHAGAGPSIDDEIDFSLIEGLEPEESAPAPIPLDDDDHLEIPLEIEEHEAHDPQKRPG